MMGRSISRLIIVAFNMPAIVGSIGADNNAPQNRGRGKVTPSPIQPIALAPDWLRLYRWQMSWNSSLYAVAAVLLTIALGVAAAVFSEKSSMQRSAHVLWALTLIFLTAALAYVITAQVLNWF
jgi:ABC-type Fe3+ transport system permease subunit